jgi:NAD-dependent deacetylase
MNQFRQNTPKPHVTNASEKEPIVVFTGAGVSAESGLITFRDMGGLWRQYDVTQVASPSAWKNNPELVLQFYNERREKVMQASPNAAHHAIASLEVKYDVTVITQNVDDLHERAGSRKVIHLHGEIRKVRSSLDSNLIYEWPEAHLDLGQLCEKGSQLRPHIVWFGEQVFALHEAAQLFGTAQKVLVVGTSLVVQPAASLLDYAPFEAEKILINPEPQQSSLNNYRYLQGTACQMLPHLVSQWLSA